MCLITVTASVVRIVTIPQQLYYYYRRHRQGSRAASSSSQQQLAYSQQSNTTACVICSCAFEAQVKNEERKRKNGEKTITEDACVSLRDISYSHLIVQYKQQKTLSLFYEPYSLPSLICSSFPFIKNATNTNFYCNGTNRWMDVFLYLAQNMMRNTNWIALLCVTILIMA